MAKFTIYSPSGAVVYTGTPTFTGQYMKPGVLEFRDIPSPIILSLEPGCYVDYTRTGYRYRIYTTPQLKKQARSSTYGGAFVYQGVQLFDASKMLEYCPFRDLVKGDNRIHFSTQPSISTFEGCDGLARRFEACLRDQYDVNGVQSWAVRIATRAENPDLYDLMMEPREFTVSGVNILECLDKIYEIWPEVGWVYKVENGIDTIVIGGGGLTPNVGTYAYGKGNGLTSLTRVAANSDEIANRIFAYGSSRNMLPRWYNNKPIKDAESVDIQNLMIPIPEWGLTDNLPDAAKAFVENAQSIAKNGLRPATVYFDGTGEYPAIYPSIRETTIAMVRTALGDSTAKYYPSPAVYTDGSERIDKLLFAQPSFDSGLAGDSTGRANYGSQYEDINVSTSTTFPSGTVSMPVYNYQGTYKPSQSGNFSLSFGLNFNGAISMAGMKLVNIAITIRRPEYQGAVILSDSREITPEPGASSVQLTNLEFTSARVPLDANITYNVLISITVVAEASDSDRTCSVLISGGIVKSISNYRASTFTVKLRQVGFDINEQAALGEGKTIAMRTGKCAGRSFAIKTVQYDSSTDSWTLECWRSEDESLSQWFPNTDYPVRGKEANYDGDEFVFLDIAMPDIYISMAEQKLYAAALDLLSDMAIERWQYSPEIDAKFMVESGRTIRAGEYLVLYDTDVIGESPVSIIVDTITINEGEAAIPTYKVTLRDRKKKTWTESESVTSSSSKSVGDASYQQSTTNSYSRDSFFEEVADPNDGSKKYVQLKEVYTGLMSPFWMAAGGVGSPGSGGGGGGGGLINSVKGVADLNTPIATESLTETFSSKAIQTIWDAVKVLQNTTPNVSLVNGANNSTLVVNGTTAAFYTKSQIDAIVGAVYRPAGNAATVSELGTLTATNIGKVYNMTAAFTTTADFLEGAGKSFPAGTNVVIVDAGSGTCKYDVLSGFVDLSGYAQKVVGATNGNFAGLDANGNITDSGHKHGDYVTALGTSGNNLTWTKNGVTNNITVPFATNATTATKIGTATVGSSHRPIYINAGTPTQVTDVGMDYIGWPIANHGTFSSLDNLYYNVGPNVLAYPKPDYIDAEYSNDGGVTWLDYGLTDTQKRALFTTSGSVSVGKKGTSGVTTDDAARITIHAGVGAYCKCEFIAFRHYFAGACDVTIEYTTYADQTTYVEHTTLTKISGTPGYRVIPFSKFIFGNNGVHDLRITYRYNGTSYANLSHSISEIRVYGSNVYSTPSTLAKTGHVYSYDADLNVTFPSTVRPSTSGLELGSSSSRWKLYATTGDFNGLLTGVNANFSGVLNLAGASSATDTTKGVNLSYSNATAHIGLSTLLGIYSSGNIVLRPNGASASGAGNGSLTISTDGIVANEKITAEGLVSSGALTLSGSTNTARRIYFGDTNHYLELDEHGFHFSHGVYSEDFVSAGGIGNGSGSGSATELGDLVDVSLTNRSNGDLLVYNSATSHWENKPQSSIIPTVSVSFDDLTSHPTTLAGYGITDAYTKTQVDTLLSQVEPDPNVFATRTWVLSQNFLQPADLAGYVTFNSLETELADYVPNTRKVNGHALTSDIVLAKGDVGLGNVENTALSTWTGSQNITTVGTIASGTWRGTPIANDKIANAFVSIAGNNVPLGASLSTADLRNSLGIPTVESNIATIMSWFSEDANGNIVVNPKSNNTPRGLYNIGWISTGGVGSGGGSGSGNAAWGTVTDTGVNLTVDGITRLLARGDKNKMVTLSEDDYANLATKYADTYYFTYEE